MAAETSLGVISEYNLKKQSVHSQASGAVQIALCSQVSITGELSHLGYALFTNMERSPTLGEYQNPHRVVVQR